MDQRVIKVYIVDDDNVYRFTTEKYIQMLNLSVEVKSFVDGEEAIDDLKEQIGSKGALPDIILLDINMPVMDGWDFLEEYEEFKSQLTNNIKIYLITSSEDERDRGRAQHYSSVSDYLVKPINEEYLKRLLTD